MTSFSQHRYRSGLLYIHVMFMAAIIAAIATASLQFHRSQSFEVAMGQDFADARRYAHAAIDIAMLRMRRYPDWRTRFNDPIWAAEEIMEDGTYSIEVTDKDNDLDDEPYEPVSVSVTGRKGVAVYRLSVDVDVGPGEGSCLDVAMLAGDNTSFLSSTCSSDHIITSNGQCSANVSNIYAQVEAGQNITGSMFHQSKTQFTKNRLTPDDNQVPAVYVDNSSTFNASALPRFRRTEILLNTTFESNTNGWVSTASPNTCTLSRNNARPRSGSSALRVNHRSNFNSNAVYVATTGNVGLTRLISGHEYELKVPIWIDNFCDIKILCTIYDSNNVPTIYGQDSAWFRTKRNSPETGGYNHPSLVFRPIFQGSVTRMEMQIRFKQDDDTYFIDDPSLIDITYPDDVYVFEQNVLSSTHNPYGSTNANGLYCIQCAGKNVVFGWARIVGTVVLQGPGSLSGIYGPVNWRPHHANYPAILSDSSLVFNAEEMPLSESEIGTNLNPGHSPFPWEGGTADSTLDDSYASEMEGIIYAADDIRINKHLKAKGVMIARDDIFVESANVVLTYDRRYAEDPPIGFDTGLIELNIIPGSWRREVD